MRVTTKGQVTIPRKVREALGITPQTEVEFVEDNGKFYIVKTHAPQPTGKFKQLRGIATANLTTDEIMSLTRERA
ncbi:MAG: AbrB/MazE/SpoVT family DNA-binding domain-containing protein [Cyanobacteria bacterium J06642_2]